MNVSDLLLITCPQLNAHILQLGHVVLKNKRKVIITEISVTTDSRPRF